MKYYRLPHWVFVSIFFSILLGCQSMNGTVGGYFGLDTDLKIIFEVDADINPDEQGKASPLFIRMYELKAKKMMRKADFIEIYERDKEILGADLLSTHKLKRFKPGENRNEHFVLTKDTHYVALYAEFLEYNESKYKLIIPVVANNVFRNSVTIRVSGNKLIIDEVIEDNLNTQEEDEDDDFSGDYKKAQEGAGKAGKLF